jgi:hypothetical protein
MTDEEHAAERAARRRCRGGMRTKTAAVLAVLVTLVVAGATPAGAKGATGGTIDGEGIDDAIAVPADLSGESGLYELIWETDGATRLAAAPTDDLGPRLVITWMLMGPNGDVPIEQEVYPYAASGPVTYVAPGQPMWESARTLGGWATAPQGLVMRLEALGVSRSAAVAGGGGTEWAPIGASVMAMAALGIGVTLLSRRRGEVAPAAG